MKSADLKVGVEYAVIPAWDYSSADKKNPDRVERRYVSKAQLVSLDKYEYKVFRSENATSTNFAPANKGSRNIGYLVSSDDFKNAGQTSSTIFWLARPQDIVAPYADLEPKWAQRELDQKLAQEKYEAEQQERERKQREAREYMERVSASLMASLKSILGDRADQISIGTRNRRIGDNYIEVGEVSVDLKTMGILIEKVLEAKDLVG